MTDLETRVAELEAELSEIRQSLLKQSWLNVDQARINDRLIETMQTFQAALCPPEPMAAERRQ